MALEVNAFFNMRKLVDAYIDCIPQKNRLSSSAVLQIRSYVSAVLLEAMLRGETAELSIQAALDHACCILEEDCRTELLVVSELLGGEITTLCRSVAAELHISASEATALVEVIAGECDDTIEIQVRTSGLSGEVLEAALAQLRIEAEAQLPTLISTNQAESAIYLTATETDTLTGVLQSGAGEITITATLGRMKIGYYRVVNDLSAFTIADLRSMSLGELFYVEQ